MSKPQSILDGKRTRRQREIAKEYDTFNQLDNITFEGQWIGQNERLELRCWNSNANLTVLTMRVRMMHLNGDIVFRDYTHVPASDRSETNALYDVGIGWILSVMVYEDPGTSKRGQTFVIVDIYQIRDQFHSYHLVSNYVAEPFHPSWPDTPLIEPIEGPGYLRTVVGTNPAAGVEISETVPTNARWRLVAITAELVCSATVATRTPKIYLDDGTNVFSRSEAGPSQAASNTTTHTWGALGDIIYLAESYRIRTVTTNIQSGDNWGAPVYLVEEWIQP